MVCPAVTHAQQEEHKQAAIAVELGTKRSVSQGSRTLPKATLPYPILLYHTVPNCRSSLVPVAPRVPLAVPPWYRLVWPSAPTTGEAMLKSHQNRGAPPGSSFDKPDPYGSGNSSSGLGGLGGLGGGGGSGKSSSSFGGLGGGAGGGLGGNLGSMMDDLNMDLDKDPGDGGWGAGGKDDFGFGSAAPPPEASEPVPAAEEEEEEEEGGGVEEAKAERSGSGGGAESSP